MDIMRDFNENSFDVVGFKVRLDWVEECVGNEEVEEIYK